MKRKPTPKNSDWNISFWFVILWPLIAVAIVAIGFLVPALVKTHEGSAAGIEGHSAVRCRTVEIAFGARAGRSR